jgi:hypothetical protein
MNADSFVFVDVENKNGAKPMLEDKLGRPFLISDFE